MQERRSGHSGASSAVSLPPTMSEVPARDGHVAPERVASEHFGVPHNMRHSADGRCGGSGEVIQATCQSALDQLEATLSTYTSSDARNKARSASPGKRGSADGVVQHAREQSCACSSDDGWRALADTVQRQSTAAATSHERAQYQIQLKQASDWPALRDPSSASARSLGHARESRGASERQRARHEQRFQGPHQTEISHAADAASGRSSASAPVSSQRLATQSSQEPALAHNARLCSEPGDVDLRNNLHLRNTAPAAEDCAAQSSAAVALGDLSAQLRSLLSTEERMARRARDIRRIVPSLPAADRQQAGSSRVTASVAIAPQTCSASARNSIHGERARGVIEGKSLAARTGGAREVDRLLQELTDSLAELPALGDQTALPAAAHQTQSPADESVQSTRKRSALAPPPDAARAFAMPQLSETTASAPLVGASASPTSRSSTPGRVSSAGSEAGSFASTPARQPEAHVRAAAAAITASPSAPSSVISGLTPGLPTSQLQLSYPSSTGAPLSTEAERTVQQIEDAAARFFATAAQHPVSAPAAERRAPDEQAAKSPIATSSVAAALQAAMASGLSASSLAQRAVGAVPALDQVRRFSGVQEGTSIADSAPLSEGEMRCLRQTTW